MDKKMINKLIRIIISFFLVLLLLLINFDNNLINIILYVIAYIIVGYDIMLKAIRNIIRGKVFDENFLMSIATVGAFFISEYTEAVAVMLFYQVGELFQSYAVDKSRKSVAKLMDIRPDYANVYRGDEVVKVSPDEVGIDDIILVKPGEKIPLDGVVVDGVAMLNTVALTGESLPRRVKVLDEVLSGCINNDGTLKIRVKKEFGESTVSKILDLVENASSRKAKSENFISKFAKYYTPIVVIIALFLAFIPPLLIENTSFSEWIYRALSFLVVSCPCALVISIPLSFFGGIGASSKNGVLIKGSNYLEALSETEIVVCDKTGTLTEGVFKVQKVNVNKYSKEKSHWWTTLKRRKTLSKAKTAFSGGRKNILPNASIVCSMEEVMEIKDVYGVDLMDIKHVKKLMDRYFLLGFAIVDDSQELCYFIFDGENNYQAISYKGLEKENNSKNDFKDIYKMINSGRI